MNLGPVRKAVVAGAAAAASAFAVAVSDNHLSLAEIGVVIASAVAAGAAVYGVRNKAA